MTAIDHTRRPAPVVYEIEDQKQFAPPRRRTRPLGLHEVLAVTTSLAAAGYDVSADVTRIDAIADAMDAVLARRAGDYLTGDICTMDPQDVAEAVRQYGHDKASEQAMSQVRDDYRDRLAASALDKLRPACDRIVAAMRTEFDPAVKVVQTAANLGLNPSSDIAALLETAAPKVIDAYRSLSQAASVLDRLAGFRNQMTLIGLGPGDWPITGIVTGITSLLQLGGAQNVWQGETEIVQYTTPWHGSHMARRARQRLGGPWLALVTGGYQLHLNTPDEADAVLAAATLGSEAEVDAEEPA